MRKIKGSSSYLKNQVRKNLAKAALSFIFFPIILIVVILRIILTLQIGTLEEFGLVISILPLIAFDFYLRKYRIYNGGWQGEKQVAKVLASSLSDDYYIINDLYLRDRAGDIDHIVLGPNGVFVLETKNWNGSITCNGDLWQRAGKRNFSGSPSRQVKRNAQRIKRIIDNSGFAHMGVSVEGIVVFTNKHATIKVNNPTVVVLKLPQLPSHLTSRMGANSYSHQQLEAIGTEIVRQKAQSS